MSYAYFDLGKKFPGHTQVIYEEIRDQLVKLAIDDQSARKNLPKQATSKQLKELEKEDQKRTAEMMDLLKVCGTPSAENIGLDGSRAVWVLSIHTDVSTMKKIHKIFQSLYKKGKGGVFYWGIPFLVDRIRVEEGKKQLYGTQYHFDKKNTLRNFPILKPQLVNQRRAEYDLPPIEGELDELNKQH